MSNTRKKLLVDKKFQIRISIKAIILPLMTTMMISAILIYFANSNNLLISQNNRLIERTAESQDYLSDLFLTNPAFHAQNNPPLKNAVSAFKTNISTLKSITMNSQTITRNSSTVFYILIAMTIIQTMVIFFLFIFISHKISGPLHVMTDYLRKLQRGENPDFRPLRKNDELKDFYDEFWRTISSMQIKKL